MTFNEEFVIEQKKRHIAITNFGIAHNKVEYPHSFKCPFDGQCKNCNLQNVHTPFDLCSQMVGKLKESVGSFENKDILAFNIEFIEALVYDYGVSEDRIWFLTDCVAKAGLCKELYKGVRAVSKDFFDFMNDKKQPRKFDVVIMNPPYQAPKSKEHEGRGKCGSSLWEHFVKKSFSLTNENGFVCNIHPSRWRNVGSEIGTLIRSKNLIYLEIHDRNDGRDTFGGCQTDYDWYITQNTDPKGTTVIVDQNGKCIKCDLSDMPFIPDANFELMERLVAKGEEEKVRLLHSYSAYETRKSYMSKDKTDVFKHPCAYMVSVKGELKLWFSSIKEEFFGTPKVIFSNGQSSAIVDECGEYGLTQFAYGIADNPKILKLIAVAISSKKFIDQVMNYHNQGGNRYNTKVISQLRRDFWKEFVDENGNEIP